MADVEFLNPRQRSYRPDILIIEPVPGIDPESQFTSGANRQLNPLQLVSTASGGLVYYLTKRVAASIWAAVVLHALVDFSLFSITLSPGETADNRGPVILLALVLACLVALVGSRWIRPLGQTSANAGPTSMS